MPITAYTPKTSDAQASTSELDVFCSQCEQIIMKHRGWSLDSTRTHVGRFMKLIPSWIGGGITVEQAVARMIGGNPDVGYL